MWNRFRAKWQENMRGMRNTGIRGLNKRNRMLMRIMIGGVVFALLVLIGIVITGLRTEAEASPMQPITTSNVIGQEEVASATPSAYSRIGTQEDEDGETYLTTGNESYVFITTPMDDILLMGIEPLDESHLMLDDRYVIIRTFRLPFDEPNAIPRYGFNFGGRRFDFYSIQRLDIDRTQRMEYTVEFTIETRTSDIIEIMNNLYATLLFDDGYFVGELHLLHESIRTEPMTAVSETRTMSDTRTYNNIAFGDISGIARTVTRSGVTLNLVNVDWTPNNQGTVNHTGVATTYNATARYQGTYTRNVVPGFITTALYVGEIIDFDFNPEIVYELVFVSLMDDEGSNGESASDESFYGDEEGGHGGNAPYGHGSGYSYGHYGNGDGTNGNQTETISSRNGNSFLGWVVLGVAVIGGLGFLGWKLGWLKIGASKSKRAGITESDNEAGWLNESENPEGQEGDENDEDE